MSSSADSPVESDSPQSPRSTNIVVSAKRRVSKVLFIHGLPLGRPRKDHELQKAEARSHAAKVGHRRKSPMADEVPEPSQVVNYTYRKHVFRVGAGPKFLPEHRLRNSQPHEKESANEAPLSDYTCCPGLRVDPFFCIDTANDKGVAYALDFCGQSTVPRYDILCKVFNLTQVTDFLMATIASDLPFYHVTIATTQLVLDSLHDGPFKPSRLMLHHRGLALTSLRKRLSEEHAMADPVAMCTILSLALQERALGNLAGFNLHRSNLITMLSSQAGAKSLRDKRKAKALIMQYDSFWALATGKTMFPAERASQSPSSATVISKNQLSALIEGLPEGFKQLATHGNLSINTLEILSRGAYACRWSGRASDAQKILSPAPTTPSYNDFLEACPCLFDPGRSSPASLDELALLTVLLRIFLLDMPRMLTSGLVGARAALSRKVFLYEPTSQSEHDLIIWIVMSTVEAWHFSDERLGTKDARVLVTELIMRYPVVRDLRTLRGILMRFFGAPQESRLRLIHQAMMQGTVS